MTYAEQFPRCDDCPMTVALQSERDTADRITEERTIARMLDIVQSDYEIEEIRRKLDVEYTRILDDVSAGRIDQEDPDVEIAGHIYSNIVAVYDHKEEMKQKVDEYLAAIGLNVGGELIDTEAEIFLGKCSGARYRRKMVFCSSWISNIIKLEA